MLSKKQVDKVCNQHMTPHTRFANISCRKSHFCDSVIYSHDSFFTLAAQMLLLKEKLPVL